MVVVLPKFNSMKRIVIMALCVVLAMGAAAQGNKTKTKTKDMKTLVAYFSCTGTTRAAATKLSKELGADLFEITPEKAYTSADLDWRNKQSRSSVEMADRSSRPAIKSTVENMADYSVVYIGFPIWWYTAPTIINTFIEAHDLGGKEIHLFATSGGSTPDKALKDMKAAYTDYNFVDAKLMR